MGAISNYLEGQVLGHVFKGVPFTAPSAFYVELFTTAPNSEDGTGGVVCSGTGYSRKQITSWTGPTGNNGTIANGNVIDFGTAAANWGTIVAAGVYDASSNGNLLLSGSLASSKTPAAGDSVSFIIGALTFRLDD